MIHQSTYGYLSFMDEERMFKSMDMAKAYDRECAMSVLNLRLDAELSDDRKKAIKFLAELIKSDDLDAYIARMDADADAKRNEQ